MKKLQSFGEPLSKVQQKQIMGGYSTTIYCKKQETTADPCEIPLSSPCPPQTEWRKLCEKDTKCKDYTHSTGCS